jgi:hypothetical protein
MAIFAWLHGHWAELIALGWAIEKVLEIVATLTPWKGDDNLGILLGKFLGRFSKKPVR